MPQPFREFTVRGTSGVELRCYDAGGSGPAIVILHGLAGSAREFFPTAVLYGEDGLFDEAAKAEFVQRGRNVTRVDLPGASHDAHLDSFGPWVAALRGFVLS